MPISERLAVHKPVRNSKRKAGRPRLDKSRKSEGMYLRLTKSDMAAMKNTAQNTNLSVPEFVRRSVRLVLHGQADISRNDMKALTRLLREINAIGRNLNQITRRLNARTDIDATRLTDAHDQLNDQLREVRGAQQQIIDHFHEQLKGV